MNSILAIALSNACVAALIAGAALAASRWTRNAPLAHFLWLLVFVKLLTPPLLEVRVPLAGLLGSGATTTAATGPETSGASGPALAALPAAPGFELDGARAEGSGASAPEECSSATEGAAPLAGGEALDPRDDAPLTSAAPSDAGRLAEPTDIAVRAGVAVVPAAGAPAAPPAVPAAPPAPAPPLEFTTLLASAWLTGSVLWFALAASRLLRFRRLLRKTAAAAPAALAEETRLVAARLGLARAPDVIIVAARISPLVWAFGARPRLVLPAELTTSLTRAERRTLIAHELAHLRRRDHWLRWVEMLGLGLYWWFPVVWWARRELRAVEEECCDAWVQWAFPDEVDGYARTLFRTIDFLSQDPAAMPAGASGMGHVSLLERRLRMILESRLHRRVSMPCRAALAAFAALVLPWTAGLTAREASPADEPGQAGEAQEPGGDPASPSGPAATGTDVPGEAAPGADLESQIEALQRQIEALNKQIQDLQGVGKARTRTPASNLPAGATGTAGRRPGKGAGRGVEGLPVTVGDRQCLVDVAGNVVTLWDPGKNAIRWQTKLDGDLSRAKISQDGKLLRVDRPGRTVTLDLATGKTVSDVALDPAAGKIASGGSRPPMAGALAGAGGQQGFKDPLTQHGAALGARGYAANDASWPAAAGPGIQPSGPPVDVVRLAEALIEAQGAAALARNKLERLAPAESAGVVSRTESSTLKVEIETAERKVDLLRRLARSALKGTHLEMERLREVEELANRRLKAGEASQEAVLAVQLRLANVETLADLLENILSETPAAKR